MQIHECIDPPFTLHSYLPGYCAVPSGVLLRSRAQQYPRSTGGGALVNPRRYDRNTNAPQKEKRRIHPAP